MQLINTINIIPQPSLEQLEIPIQRTPQRNDQQNSFAQHISLNQTAPNSAKKKKSGCTCKKTYCLKMYCECFSTGKQCGDDCGCTGCKNMPGFQEVVATAKTAVKQGGLRNCSLAQKRCNCKKSHCRKRYCECYNSGVGCTEACKCQGCQNHGHQKEQQPQHEHKIEQVGSAKQINQGSFPTLGERSIDDFQKFCN